VLREVGVSDAVRDRGFSFNTVGLNYTWFDREKLAWKQGARAG
jgi:hypothetical protein